MDGGGDSNQKQQQQQQKMQQHQQWLAMQQYQQQWMAMQQHMMYNQHYMTYYHQQFLQQQHVVPQKQGTQIQNAGEENNTIWIGDLQQWMDENYLHSCFSQTGEVASVKVIRNKQTGQSERYGFIEFSSHTAAENVLQSFNGSVMPNTDQVFRLNWASFCSGDRHPDNDSDLSIFVGDLATEVTDEMLQETFASNYPSVKAAKVVVDASGCSKGYGFVRFNDENERDRALAEMNGVYCSSRPMRIGAATPKKSSGHKQYSSQAVILAGGYAGGSVAAQTQPETDSSNTTIFIGGLDSDASDDDLRQCFSPFGEILSIKIPAGKGCGFIQFGNRSNAEDALERLDGTMIGKQAIRLSWGMNKGNKQFRGEGNGNGAYYPRHGYNGQEYGYGYGYGAASNGHANHNHTLI